MLTVIVLSAVMVASCKKTPRSHRGDICHCKWVHCNFHSKGGLMLTSIHGISVIIRQAPNPNLPIPMQVSGNYTVTLAVKGDGGSASAEKDITIEASFLEMLTGGTTATNGKTWVLDQTATPEIDGRGPVSSSMPVTTAPTDGLSS